MWSLATAGTAARCLHVVATLAVAHRIDTGAVPVTVLAEECDADPDALDRVLRLLAGHGVFARTDDGYRHSPASELLRDDHSTSMRSFAQMMGQAGWRSLTELEHTLRTGRPGVELLKAEGFWTYLRARPTEAAVFGRAMDAKAGAEVAGVLDADDFRRFETVADGVAAGATSCARCSVPHRPARASSSTCPRSSSDPTSPTPVRARSTW